MSRTSAGESDMMAAAPTPCSTRAKISRANVPLTAHKMEPTVNSATPLPHTRPVPRD